MELILREDVENLGFKDDIVTVKNGYGRNFLIPQGKAILATDTARKVLAENLKQRAFKEQKLIDDANKLSKALLKLDIKIASKVGTGDKLLVLLVHKTWLTPMQMLAKKLTSESLVYLDVRLNV